ncbi:MAG TPA: hypothetical protein EYG70_06760, partial [Sulfurimonas sp.]|nr:hypothetical protein [Sulfurimonas sp.]
MKYFSQGFKSIITFMVLFYVIGLSASVVGTTKGEFTVNQGVANYNLKIDVPPGVAGMEPKLSLNYSSGGGNGYMGIGWNIGGVSAITRCPQTKTVDGKSHKFGVQYNANDRFCLDGQRLINVRGAYGKSTTEYRTEINNYSKITQVGMRSDGPDYFKVQTKSGLTYYYGWYGENGSHKSYNLINGRKTFWKVSRISDTYGNHIYFQYKNNYELGYHYLYRVKYSNNSITYGYETRPDQIKGYIAGNKVRIYSRLKQVVVKTASTEVRRYNITYTNETRGSRRSKVATITEHVSEGDLKQLKFTWISSNKRSFTNKASTYLEHLGEGVSFNKTKGRDKGTRLVDINGDGLVDIIQLYLHKGGIDSHRRVYLNTGKTFKHSGTYSQSLPDAFFSDTNGESMGTQLSDINGDGLVDIIQLYDPAGTDYYGGKNQQRIWINDGKQFVNKSSSYFDRFGTKISFNKSKGRDKGTRLADINGDGLMDIIQLYLYKDGDHKRVYINNGKAFRYNESYSKYLPNAYFSDTDGQSMGTQLSDINGDGLVDLIQLYNPDSTSYYGGKNQQHVWINNGFSFVDKSSTYLKDKIGGGVSFNKSKGRDKGTRLVDINADGLVDIIQLYTYDGGAHRRVYLNRGNTFGYSQSYSDSLPDAYFSNTKGESMGTQLADMNGDGLVDIIQLYDPGTSSLFYGGKRQKRVFLNTGVGFEMIKSYALPTLSLHGIKGYSKGTRIVDINGDGFLDIIQLYNSEGTLYNKLYINTNKKPLISHIYNSKDQNIYIGYKNMTDKASKIYATSTKRNTEPYNSISKDNIPVVVPMPLVYSVKSANGVGGYNTIEYKYHDYIINKIRGLQGFRYIINYDTRHKMASGEIYKQIESTRGRGFQYTGMPKYTYVGRPYSGSGANKQLGTWGKWLSKTEISYSNASNDSRLYEPYTASNKQTIYDPTSKRTIKAIYHYNTISKDGLGNIVKTVDKTEDYVNKKKFYKTSINEYRAEKKDKWHIGRLSKSTVKHSQTDGYSVTRSSTFKYNSKGVLYEEIANAGTTLALRKYYKYDSDGNKVYESVSGQGVKTAITRFSYNSSGEFQTGITDASGLKITKYYDGRFGTVTYLKDANGLVTRWKYDGMGRKIESTAPDGVKTTWTHLWDSGRTRGIKNSIYSVGISSAGKPFTKTYYDSLGRDVGSYTYTMNKEKKTSLDSRRIIKRKYYNSKGQLYKEELPHYETRGAKYIYTSYDKYGRVIKASKPGPNNKTQTYNTSYKNFTTIVTDPLKHKKRTIENAIGQTMLVTDAYESKVSSSIKYKYDAIGNLKQTSDSKKNTIYMSYDVAGNKIYMNDPDLEKWHYEYNAAGQLKKQWNGIRGFEGSRHATYKSYDALGRVVKTNTYNAREHSADASHYSYNYQTFTYGGTSAKKGSKGKLLEAYASSKTKKTDWHSETKTMRYDSLGRLIQTKTEIPGVDIYTTKSSYDSYSRVASVTYPNGYKIYNHYNSGILDYVKGSDGKIHYNVKSRNAFGEVSEALYANKVRTVIGHNDAGYVGIIRSGQNGAYYTGNVQQVQYTYDGLGNVKTRKDDSIDGKYLNEAFRYDAMNRLTSFSVNTNITREAFRNGRVYRYDRLGNMTHKSGYGDYKYYADKPHAVRSVGDRTYTYDYAGNMTNRNGDHISYTPSNKPAILKGKNGNEVRFYYGVGGQRFMKVASQANLEKQTVYLGKGYEEEISSNSSKEVKSTIYINVGGKTVAMHVEKIDKNYVKTNSKYKTTYNRYFHTDALGSVTAITDDRGKVVTRRSYEPFGKIRAMDYGLLSNNAIIPSNTVEQTTRAYTGHEQIAEIKGLIHMNARVYDSDIGRFLSADTIIQDPHDSQSYNRYSYVRNNPLKYTDPTGNSWWTKFRDKYIRTIAAIVVAVVIAIYAPYLLAQYGGVAFGTTVAGTTTLTFVGTV